MPYIKFTRRIQLDYNERPENPGELNYVLTTTINDYIKNNKKCYQTYNDIMGVLNCIQMEIYRRIVAPYEDTKIQENGDLE